MHTLTEEISFGWSIPIPRNQYKQELLHSREWDGAHGPFLFSIKSLLCGFLLGFFLLRQFCLGAICASITCSMKPLESYGCC